jgi:hypothetical protein
MPLNFAAQNSGIARTTTAATVFRKNTLSGHQSNKSVDEG